MPTFLGIPYWLWAILCLVLAVVWALVWPREQAMALSGIQFVVLRWFHALAWLLLALAALLASSPTLHNTAVPRTVALAALPVYFFFLAVVVSSQPS